MTIGSESKAFYQQTTLVVGGGIDGPRKNSAPRSETHWRAAGAALGDAWSSTHSKKPKKAGFLFVESIMGLIDNGSDAAHYLAVFLRDKKFRFGIVVKRMFVPVQKFLHGDMQWRHPMGVVAIEPVRQFYELFKAPSDCQPRQLQFLPISIPL